ncbi:MAG: pseudouridine-5'-phosphate glycosidase [Flavobacteriales bacterium]|nr:pseudouridine-5'-phosphate glycosidase [Flavobacteriales bacterium]
MKDIIEYSEEVREAMGSGVPVVALESTIIAHGMPYPENVNTAKRLGSIIRDAGCVPAIIAISGGKVCVGIDDALLERIAKEKDVLKVSRRDIPIVIASKGLGATTVSGTLVIAHAAGIKVFVTGGIGGAHRGSETSMDVSSDLEELAIRDVAVVSAGVKAILDLPKTLEILETKGVPVVGYQTDELPAFYTRTSGLKLVARADTVDEVACIMKAKWDLGIGGSILIANPIPHAFEADAKVINAAIENALVRANELGVSGKEITPFILSHVSEATGGDSLAANVALVENNARLGAKIAFAFAKRV